MPAPAVSSAAGVGTVDCHFHVVADAEQFPMLAGRSYTPAPASLQAWRDTLGPLGVTHGVIVQPSFYGVDNRVLLEALRQSDGQLVGVAAVAPDVSEAQLDTLAQAGVRGVRVAHFEPGDPRALGGFVLLDAIADVQTFSRRLQARGMHLQLLTDSRLLPGIAERLQRFGVPVVIDHMGRTPAHLGATHAGVQSMARLLSEGRIWVKLSGLANISEQGPQFDDAQAIHAALLAANPEQLVWGSDWPHTKPAGVRPHTADLLQRFHDWTPLDADRQRILSLNPARLYRL